jgi:RimJ/RimL family protein N-acetyltransferase/AcrR family transcriptional regulator
MRPERADAVRNRLAIMAATEDLLTRYEPAQVSIERIAAAAGVGKATVFHRFGSRAELMQAVAHSRVESLRIAVTDGPPPLGPGAPARERLMAFLNALIEHASRSIGLLTAQEHAALTSKISRDENPIYLFWHGHIAALLSEAGGPALDADLQAHVILGSLHDATIARMLRDGQAERVAASLRQLAGALIRPHNDRVLPAWSMLPPRLDYHPLFMDDPVALRPVREDDLAMLDSLVRDPEMSGEFGWFGWFDLRRWRRGWEENQLIGPDGGVLIVTLGDKPLGMMNWRRHQATPAAHSWELGIALLPHARGLGHGTQAHRLLARYLFAHTAVHRIWAATDTANIAEQKALEKAGFTREGVQRGIGWRDGAWRDGVTYSLLRTDPTV